MKHNGERRQFEQELFEREAAICRAFANRTRLRLLDALAQHERSLSGLQKRLGVSGSNLSQHLTVLKSAGVVLAHRRGNQVFCSLRMPEVKEACGILRKLLRAQIRLSRRWMPKK
jgi:DNA-binding transcriptional ArsR family regulator